MEDGDRVIEVPPGYESLMDVFASAVDQAAYGKGVERHGLADTPFEEQQSALITRWLSIGYPMGQCVKKVLEAGKMMAVGTWDRARGEQELLGAINYLGLAIIELRRRNATEDDSLPTPGIPQ